MSSIHEVSVRQGNSCAVFYLPENEWSPRYETSFFTISLRTRTVYDTHPPHTGIDHNTARNRHHPAVYFNLKVKCGKKENVCPRRYSQFRNLYDELRRDPPVQSKHTLSRTSKAVPDECAQLPLIPPKTCFFSKLDDEFLNTRQEELYTFLDECLKRPDYSKHPSIRQFLELYTMEIETPLDTIK